MDPKRPKPSPDDPAQSELFVKAAKRLQTDESDKSFMRLLAKLLKPKAKPRQP